MKFKRYLKHIVLIMLIIINILYTQVFAANANQDLPSISAQAAILIDANSGTVLFSKNAR